MLFASKLHPSSVYLPSLKSPLVAMHHGLLLIDAGRAFKDKDVSRLHAFRADSKMSTWTLAPEADSKKASQTEERVMQ